MVGIGAATATAAPVALLDVGVARSGVDGRVASVTPFYATGPIPGFAGSLSPIATPVGGAEFRHSNQTQGIGFAFDGIYATGSVAGQHFGFTQRGNGHYFIYHQLKSGGQNFVNFVGEDISTPNHGWYTRWYAAGVQEFGSLMRKSARVTPGGGLLADEWFFQARNELGTFRNKLYLGPSACGNNLSRMEIGENDVNDDKLVLYGLGTSSFFGFGIKASTLASFVSNNAGHFRFYQGACPGTQVFGVSGVGDVTVDPGGVAPAGWSSPVLRFGAENSNDGIRSQRTVVDRFQNDVEFYTGAVRRGAFLSTGRFYLATVPTFATDALAGAGGLLVGEVYKDVFGALRIKL